LAGRDEASLSRWLERRAEVWRALASRLDRRRRRGEPPREALAIAEGLRNVSRDLSLAQSIAAGSRLTRYLRHLYLRVHDAVNCPPRAFGANAYEALRDRVPAATWAMRRRIVAAVAFFIASALVGATLVTRFPELASLFASEEMIAKVQRGELWTEDMTNVLPSSLISIGILTNNIVVSLTAFLVGVFYGLGTVYIIGLNGLMLGGVFAFTAQHGLAGDLAAFVVPHGVVELSIICLSGAAGIGLGEAIIRPGRLRRVEAFQAAVREGGLVIFVGVVFLIGAGFIEGYISPDDGVGWPQRLLVGLGYFAVLVLVLIGLPWRLANRRGWT
jgi:uncharacterized membrane protein SpoIIM required for sporulation